MHALLAVILVVPALRAAAPACGTCHPEETARYLASPMGRSLGPPEAVAGGVSQHQRSGSTVRIEQKDGKMFHQLSERGLSAEYPIAYQIGAGKFAHTYVTSIKGYLFESPVTWFRAGGWDSSPGYAPAPVIDFDRPITSTCLFCHAGRTDFHPVNERQQVTASLAPVSCERCHGSGEKHMENPSRENIVQPARLAGRVRDSVCEQCHLEAEVRILNPGKSWNDYRPGDALEQVIASYVFRADGQHVKPVNQVEQLAESRCAKESGGKLWCGTCHNPHGETGDRAAELKGICQSCHATLSKTAHPAATRECTSCHMPRVESEYVHVAVTNHTIARRPVSPPPASAAKTLAAWMEPPEKYRPRNLALANLSAGLRLGVPALVETGLTLTASVPRRERNSDPLLLEAACRALLIKGKAGEAVELCRLAAKQQPESPDRAMNLGIALARAGDGRGAERELLRAIGLDPSLKHAYVQLWTLYDQQGNRRGIADTMRRFLEWNPQNIMFRVLQETLAEKPSRLPLQP